MVTTSSNQEGVLYTEYDSLKADDAMGSLWSYESRAGIHRPAVVRTADGNHEFWLEPSDPLLNTMLPGTGVSVIVNGADCWSVGLHDLGVRTKELPKLFVVGPQMRARVLRVGTSVRAVGAAFSSIHASRCLGVKPSRLVDQIAPLQNFLPVVTVERLASSVTSTSLATAVAALKTELVSRQISEPESDAFATQATQLIRDTSGRLSTSDLAKRFGVTRQRFAREFTEATGIPPKRYARLTRFQSLLRRLLTTNVSEWVEVSSAAGFYDQAHMINEFRHFTGVSPIEFFRPHGEFASSREIEVRGRPFEWRKPRR